MLKALFFLWHDEQREFYDRFLSSFLHGSRELYYVYVYLVGMYVSFKDTSCIVRLQSDSLEQYKGHSQRCQPFFLVPILHLRISIYKNLSAIRQKRLSTVTKVDSITICSQNFYAVFLCTGLIYTFYTYKSLWINYFSTIVAIVSNSQKALSFLQFLDTIQNILL